MLKSWRSIFKYSKPKETPLENEHKGLGLLAGISRNFLMKTTTGRNKAMELTKEMLQQRIDGMKGLWEDSSSEMARIEYLIRIDELKCMIEVIDSDG